MVMKILRSFDRNLIDLLSDAYKWEYTDINDNKRVSLSKKPKVFFDQVSMGLVYGWCTFSHFLSKCI